jgi:hypothetical protein
MTQRRLTSEQRELFRLVQQAAACNPFSDERIDLDRRIAGVDPQTERYEALFAATARVQSALHALEQAGPCDVNQYDCADRDLLEKVLLFDLFHHLIEDFDAHICRQVECPGKPLRLSFAGDVIGAMTSRGFPEESALHYLAKFYQLRRAYYFIYFAASGTSTCMRTLRNQLWNNIFTFDNGLYDRHMWNRMEDFSTLLLGETGTGKGTAALAIGRSGFIPYDPARGCFAEDFTSTFLSINLSQFSAALIESELFGHRKGAFTGAIESHDGILSRCSPFGAIFLDEIGDVSIPIQIKLLQVLQERKFSPVGSHETKPFQGRVIAATNKSLNRLRQEGHFRDDFYYRLCSDEITLPPLRERIQQNPGELSDLVDRILQRICGERVSELNALVLESLHKHPGPDYTWPGNVRELEQAVRRILLKNRYERQTVSSGREDRLLSGIQAGALSAQDILSSYTSLLYERFGTYEDVAQRMDLDWRTVKKYIETEK